VALCAAAVWLVAGGWSCLFDRNGDGVDDGGLDLCAHTASAASPPLVSPLRVVDRDRPGALVSDPFRPLPRSPPGLSPSS
jgi:hypothetical protein